MPSRSSKRPRDANQLAKLIVDLATGEIDENSTDSDSGKNPAAVALGKLGGKKGGQARAKKLTPEQRTESPYELAHHPGDGGWRHRAALVGRKYH